MSVYTEKIGKYEELYDGTGHYAWMRGFDAAVADDVYGQEVDLLGDRSSDGLDRIGLYGGCDHEHNFEGLPFCNMNVDAAPHHLDTINPTKVRKYYEGFIEARRVLGTNALKELADV